MQHDLFHCKNASPAIGRSGSHERFFGHKTRRSKAGLRHRTQVGSFEAIIAYGASGRKPNMNERRPSFQFVMSIAVKDIGSANGDARRCRLDSGKGRVIVHHVVGKENLLPATAAHVQRGRIIQCARCANASKEPVILFVPEAMWLQAIFLLRPVNSRGFRGNTRRRWFLIGWFLRVCGYHGRKNNQKKQARGSDSLRVPHSRCCRSASLQDCLLSQLYRNPLQRILALFCCRIRNPIAPDVVIPFRRRYLEF